jgi:hypothetical protein
MDDNTKATFDRLTALAAEDANALTAADVEFLRARSEYLTDEQHAIIEPLFRTAGEGNLVGQAVSNYDLHLKDTNVAHPISETIAISSTEAEKEAMARETDEQLAKRAMEVGVKVEDHETRPELMNAIIAGNNPTTPETQSPAFDAENATVAELKTELDRRGIKYASTDRKPDLQAKFK